MPTKGTHAETTLEKYIYIERERYTYIERFGGAELPRGTRWARCADAPDSRARTRIGGNRLSSTTCLTHVFCKSVE